MKKGLYRGLVLVLALLLCACTTANRKPSNTTPPTFEPTTDAIVTTAATTAPPETTLAETEATQEQTEPTQEETKPQHTALYLPDCTTQQILEYFEEVVLHIEYTDGTGNASLVQKWAVPLYYEIYGAPTEEDLAVLADLFAQLNAVEGFPGIYAAEDDVSANLSLHFLDPESFNATFSSVVNGEDACGATQFWFYTDTNDIYTANVGYRTDLDQTTRNSILIEEIINTLGITDTELRPDSIVYQYSDDNLALSDIDWVILKLLYDPAIQCGMDFDSCAAVIETLYY